MQLEELQPLRARGKRIRRERGPRRITERSHLSGGEEGPKRGGENRSDNKKSVSGAGGGKMIERRTAVERRSSSKALASFT